MTRLLATHEALTAKAEMLRAEFARWSAYREALQDSRNAARALLDAGMPELDVDAICAPGRSPRAAIARNLSALHRARVSTQKRIEGVARALARTGQLQTERSQQP